ncbi:MAG: hypothetical protein Q9187_005525 [Circinaria calcarea]
MAESGRQGAEHAAADHEAAAVETSPSEPHVTEPLQYVGTDSDVSLQEAQDPEKTVEADEKQIHPEAHRTVTASSVTSTSTTEPRTTTRSTRKPWYKRLNPLRRGPPPPIPKQRTVSREYGASFFSMLTFQWMAPLMVV